MFFDILHSFVNIFAGGRSDAKVILFVTYLILLFFVAIVFLRFMKKANPKPLHEKGVVRFGLITLVASFMYGLFLHVFYALNHHVRVDDFIVTAGSGELSSTTLTHTHEMKGSIAYALSLFGGNASFSTADAGGAYLHQIPDVLLIVGLGFIAASLVVAGIYYVWVLLPKLERYSYRQRTLAIILFGLISFSLVKSTVDGGILSSNVLAIGLAGICYYFWRNSKYGVYYLIGVSMVGLLTSMVLQSMDISITYISGVITLFILLLMLLFFYKGGYRYQIMLPVLLLFFASWIVMSQRDQSVYQYGQASISKGQVYYTYNAEDYTVNAHMAKNDITIESLSNLYKKNLTYAPISSPGHTCFAKAPKSELSINIRSFAKITKSQFENQNTMFIKLRNLETRVIDNEYDYSITLELDQCTPELLGSLAGYMKRAGLDDFMMVNPKIDGRSDF